MKLLNFLLILGILPLRFTQISLECITTNVCTTMHSLTKKCFQHLCQIWFFEMSKLFMDDIIINSSRISSCSSLKMFTHSVQCFSCRCHIDVMFTDVWNDLTHLHRHHRTSQNVCQHISQTSCRTSEDITE